MIKGMVGCISVKSNTNPSTALPEYSIFPVPTLRRYIRDKGLSIIRITVDIYGHWFPGVGRENLDAAFLVNENPKELESPSGLKRTQNEYKLDL